MIGFFTRNIGWKLLSVLLAVLLWLVFVRDPEMTTVIPAQVVYRGMPENLEINSELTQTVQLEIRGPSSQLTAESLSDVMVILDLGNVNEPGDRTYTIQPTNVSLPGGVFFNRAAPSQIRIHFEERVSRAVPVQVRISKSPPEGYRIQTLMATPESLRVIGPKSNVYRLEMVETDSIDLSGVVGSAEFQVNAYIADAQVRFEPSASSEVNVRVVVQKIDQ